MDDQDHDAERRRAKRSTTDGSARTGGAPGRSTLTSRMPASASSIARSVITQLKAAGSAPAPEDIHALAEQGTRGLGGAVPHADAIQRSFGHHDISGVRAHVGGAAAEASQAMGARAYASGDQVAFAAAPDLHLAAHEVAHVVQQRGGVRLAGGVGAAGDEYERHADAVADLVVQGKSAQGLLDTMAHRGSTGGAAVQRDDDPPAHAPEGGEPRPLLGGEFEGNVVLHEFHLVENRPIGPYFRLNVTISPTIHYGPASHAGGEHEPPPRIGIHAGAGGSAHHGIGVQAAVEHAFAHHFDMDQAVGGEVQLAREGHAGAYVTAGVFHGEGWEIEPLSGHFDVVRWEPRHEPQFLVVRFNSAARFAVQQFQVPGGPLLDLDVQGEAEVTLTPNWTAIAAWAVDEGLPWAEQALTRAGTAVTDAISSAGETIETTAQAATDMLTPAAEAGTAIETDALAGAAASGATAAASVLAFAGVAGGVIWWAHGTIAALQAADDAAQQGYIASEHIYRYCMSYVGTWFGNAGLSGPSGHAGHEAAASAIAQFRAQNAGADPTAAAHANGAMALYTAVFDATKDGFRAAAVAAAGTTDDFAAMNVEGPINRTAWGLDQWRLHGGRLGLP